MQGERSLENTEDRPHNPTLYKGNDHYLIRRTDHAIYHHIIPTSLPSPSPPPPSPPPPPDPKLTLTATKPKSSDCAKNSTPSDPAQPRPSAPDKGLPVRSEPEPVQVPEQAQV